MKKVYLAIDGGGFEHVFYEWKLCKEFVSGKPYKYAGGATIEEVRAKLLGASAGLPINEAPTSGRPSYGICSDAGTHGNPGPCEYKVCDMNGVILAHEHLGVHSNNYAELAGIKAMINIALERGDKVLWTDSSVALGWIKTRRVGDGVHERAEILSMIDDIRSLLSGGNDVSIEKWNTKGWGEIPADFNRK